MAVAWPTSSPKGVYLWPATLQHPGAIGSPPAKVAPSNVALPQGADPHIVPAGEGKQGQLPIRACCVRLAAADTFAQLGAGKSGLKHRRRALARLVLPSCIC